MISFINNENEALIYLDNEGVDEMIHCLTYLKNSNETSYNLVEGNELDRLEKSIMPEGGYTHVTYVELINLDNLEKMYSGKE